MFPVISTKRFLLRRIIASDKEKIFEGLSHKEVIRYYGVSFKTLEETQIQMDWFEDLLSAQTGIWWAICTPDDPTLLGACGFNNLKAEHKKAEIGFWLLPEFWNVGIMTEAVTEIIDYGFSELNLHRIEAVIESRNNASRALIRKLDFVYEGTLRHCEIKNGEFIDLEYYALLG